MIKNTEVLSIAEITEYVNKDKETNAEILGFIKKFSKLNLKEAKELKENLQKMNLIKMDEKHVAKLIDLMPENSEEVNKIFSDVSLNEDETNKILNTIKEFR